MEDIYKRNPLHGLNLETLVTQLVEHYGFEILVAALKLNCFKTNPSIKASCKFLKKTDWAREKVEAFYLYKFKSLPRPDDKQFALPPRDRIIPEGQEPKAPKELTLQSIADDDARRAAKAEEYKSKGKGNRRSHSRPASNRQSQPQATSEEPFNPWGKAKPRSKKEGDHNPWNKGD